MGYEGMLVISTLQMPHWDLKYHSSLPMVTISNYGESRSWAGL